MARIFIPVLSTSLAIFVISFSLASSPDHSFENPSAKTFLNQQGKTDITSHLFSGSDNMAISNDRAGHQLRYDYLNLSKNLMKLNNTPEYQTTQYIKSAIIFKSESELNLIESPPHTGSSVYTTMLPDHEFDVTKEEQSQMYLQHTFSPR